MIDPMSGNPVPPGAMPSEVRDDVPISASEGEYVLPADVVRYIGLDKIEKMVMQAKKGMAEMDQGGRIGGDPAMPPAAQQKAPPPAAPMPPMMNKGGMVKRGYAEGGLVDAQNTIPRALNPLPFYGAQGQPQGQTGVVEYVGPNGQTLRIPFHNGRALITIPPGFAPTQPGQSSEQAPPTNDTFGGREPGTAPWENNAPATPETFEGLLEAAQNSTRERSPVEGTLLSALSLLGPAGALAARAVDHFQTQSAQRATSALQGVVSNGTLPDGSMATPEQIAQATAQLTSMGATVPTAAAPTAPSRAPISPSTAPITTTSLGRAGKSGAPMTQGTLAPANWEGLRGKAEPVRSDYQPPSKMGHEYGTSRTPSYTEDWENLGNSKATPDYGPNQSTKDADGSGMSVGPATGFSPSGSKFNRGGLISRTSERLPAYMARGGLVTRNKK